MLALSIRQPWAWLICQGIKPIENRGWSTLYRGPLLIHASKKFDLAAFEKALTIVRLVHNKEFDFNEIIKLGETSEHLGIKFGGIVGMVDLVDIFDGTETEGYQHDLVSSPWFDNEEPTNRGWVLKEAAQLPFQKCNGKLGLFTPDVSIVDFAGACIHDPANN